MGAIASGGVRVLNRAVIEDLRIGEETIARAAAAEGAELARRERAFRGERGPVELAGRTVVLVDDGLATGATMRAAIAAVRSQEPAQIVVAVPVAPAHMVEELRGEVEDVVCAVTSDALGAIGLWYEDFEQTSDEDVRDLLEKSRSSEPARR
jgi:putative phosphoribosyl transferase